MCTIQLSLPAMCGAKIRPSHTFPGISLSRHLVKKAPHKDGLAIVIFREMYNRGLNLASCIAAELKSQRMRLKQIKQTLISGHILVKAYKGLFI